MPTAALVISAQRVAEHAESVGWSREGAAHPTESLRLFLCNEVTEDAAERDVVVRANVDHGVLPGQLVMTVSKVRHSWGASLLPVTVSTVALKHLLIDHRTKAVPGSENRRRLIFVKLDGFRPEEAPQGFPLMRLDQAQMNARVTYFQAKAIEAHWPEARNHVYVSDFSHLRRFSAEIVDWHTSNSGFTQALAGTGPLGQEVLLTASEIAKYGIASQLDRRDDPKDCAPRWDF